MKPETPLDICNLALAKLGQEPIESPYLYSTSNAAVIQRACVSAYHPTRRTLLCEQKPAFAICSASLLSDSIDRFHLPDDAMRVVGVDTGADCWYVETATRTLVVPGRHAVIVRYVYDCEDVTRFSHEFVESFVTALADSIREKLNRDV